MSAAGTVPKTMEAMRGGVVGILVKPFALFEMLRNDLANPDELAGFGIAIVRGEDPLELCHGGPRLGLASVRQPAEPHGACLGLRPGGGAEAIMALSA
ncbi:MAG: hypothetical protein ACJ8AI_30025 [Rhodopila sp.]